MMRIWEVEGGIEARCGAAWWRLKNALKKVLCCEETKQNSRCEPEERGFGVFCFIFG